MLRFIQFLQEKFLKGLEGFGGYAEIYEDPTANELTELTQARPKAQVGGIIAGKKLYVWDRDMAMHNEVRYKIPQDPEFLPLYLYYDWRNSVVKVELSLFTLAGAGRRGYNTPNGIKEIETRILTNPTLKKLGRIEIYPWWS
jgi:hypothetical protein